MAILGGPEILRLLLLRSRRRKLKASALGRRGFSFCPV